jgi:hypothetical protein
VYHHRSSLDGARPRALGQRHPIWIVGSIVSRQFALVRQEQAGRYIAAGNVEQLGDSTFGMEEEDCGKILRAIESRQVGLSSRALPAGA